MTVLAIVQARLGSTRLPGKVLMDVGGQPILHRVIGSVMGVRGIDGVLVATTNLGEDHNIVQHCQKLRVMYSIGHPTNVLDRFYWAARIAEADVVMRVTADCPLWNPENGTALLQAFHVGEYDYLSNIDAGTDGWDTEIFTFDALERSWREAQTPYYQEHVTVHLRTSGSFRVGRVVPARIPGNAKWSVDTEEDLARVRAVVAEKKEVA